MKSKKEKDHIKIIVSILNSGGVGILPTDTLYGIVGSAPDKKTVENIYALRKRELNKPMIILVSGFSDLKLFNIKINNLQKTKLKLFWPGKVSIIFSCKSKKFSYLHRGTNTIAVRIPDDEPLRKLLKKTGPLVAPSANLAGEKPASTLKEAKKYFGFDVDFYIDAGKLKSKPSTLIKISQTGEIDVLRQGAVEIK